MKKTPYIKSYIFLLTFCLASLTSIAQNAAISNYLSKAGDYATIYNGELEAEYSNFIYNNQPYYMSSDFASGEVTYKGNVYPKQNLRLDLYKDQLIILLPQKQYAKIVNSNEVDRVTLHNKTFIYYTASDESNLKPGYYSLLHEGKLIRVLGREIFDSRIIQETSRTEFIYSSKYYILYKGQSFQVSNKRTFSKLFPQLKKQINTFTKEHSLDFKKNKEYSLATLAAQCEKWLNQ